MLGIFSGEDVRKCMAVAQYNGIPTNGAWAVTVSELNFKFWDQNIDLGFGSNFNYQTPNVPKIHMVHSTSVFPSGANQTIVLNQPNTVYCLKSNVYLASVTFESCYPNNVIFLSENGWVNAKRYVVPQYCGAEPIWNQSNY